MKITDLKGFTILSNGLKMPYLGLGVYQVNDGKEVINSVNFALEAGYRHIDTASLYGNESGVGKAVKESSIPRSEIFVTSKVWNNDQGYDSTLRAFDKSLRLLGFDYLDLYLVHWPVRGKFKDTWKALEKLYNEKSVKAIGISNFLIHQLEDLLTSAEIKPMVNQVEFHPYLVQQPLIDFCVKNNIQFESWSPLMQGNITKVDLLNNLAEIYQKTTAQVVLRWNLQKGVVTIPKSVHKDRIISNSQLFDFELSEADIKEIDGLDKSYRFGADPNTFNF
jgi:diketogulonate reductase-like aldo/keto reductase